MVGLAKLIQGVGKLKNKMQKLITMKRSASPWDSLRLAYNVEKRRKEEGICYPILGGWSLVSCGSKWPLDHFFGHQPGKTSKQTLVGNVAQVTQMLGKFLLFTQ